MRDRRPRAYCLVTVAAATVALAACTATGPPVCHAPGPPSTGTVGAVELVPAPTNDGYQTFFGRRQWLYLHALPTHASRLTGQARVVAGAAGPELRVTTSSGAHLLMTLQGIGCA